MSSLCYYVNLNILNFIKYPSKLENMHFTDILDKILNQTLFKFFFYKHTAPMDDSSLFK